MKTTPKVKAADRTKLTDSAISSAIKIYGGGGARAELVDPSTKGLRIRPLKDGKAVWSVQLRDQSGELVRYNLGEYPTIGIAAARRLAETTRYKVREQGEDPNQARQDKREAAKNPPAPAVTLRGVINDHYGKTDIAKAKDGWESYEKRIKLVFGTLYDRPASEVTRVDLQLAADNWKSGGTASAAVRYIRPVLKWAGKRNLVAMDTAILDQPRPVAKGERFLSDDELAKLLPVLKTFKSRKKPSMHAAALRFILLTATRLDETCGAKWGEISDDGSEWTIPTRKQVKELAQEKGVKRKLKSKTEHVIPLSIEAQALLAEIRPANPKPDDLIFANRKGNPVDQWDRVAKQIQTKAGVYNWTRHDLRRTAATIMGRRGVAPFVVEAALNHKDIHSGLAGIYNKARYTQEVGGAFQILADWLDHIVQQKEAADERGA
ncbi:tyrosine-type recombinase/integrase [Acidocella sp.]|uniref:tyrosine-type recombinase/integrase n=1 Tax=Acidocella sp. TaxID=50710 RepID=UPI0017F6BDE3|nr:tyrosine-type recombinase/integrase [Acidocella sp.]NNM56501.1 tyrosine-type recombinase/integrase [Acidocella sp.]